MTALIIESLRWFVTEYHIDGFRIDAAAVLCRDKNGVPLADPPILRRIIDDPVLRSTKFFLEGWDSGEHCGAPELPFSIGRFPYGRRFCEWNPQWRDVVRTFVKGECFSISDFIRAMIGSPHFFREGEMRKEKGEFGSCHGVNFVACHDGFCLRDVVSYSKRRNTDGYDEISFNCDVEGGTEESTVNEIRARQLRNFVFMLAVSRGIPMISQGDELGFSKLGNSNTWNDERYFACQLPDDAAQCQDMEALVLFTSYMFKLRTSLPHLTGVDFFDSVTWLDCAGREYDHEETGKDEANAVEDDGYVAFVTAFNKGEDVLFVAFNNGKSSRFVRGLPYEDCVEWTVVVDTFSAQWKVDSLLSANEEITIRPQSSLLCVGKERPCMEHC